MRLQFIMEARGLRFFEPRFEVRENQIEQLAVTCVGVQLQPCFSSDFGEINGQFAEHETHRHGLLAWPFFRQKIFLLIEQSTGAEIEQMVGEGRFARAGFAEQDEGGMLQRDFQSGERLLHALPNFLRTCSPFLLRNSSSKLLNAPMPRSPTTLPSASSAAV